MGWAGHIIRMDRGRTVKKFFEGNPGGWRYRGRPSSRWLDCLEEDLRRMGVRRRCRNKAENRKYEWAVIVKEALAKL
ncbi:hypothetical protein C0J52_06061 [Blattella germanica]|nr:hypothetical protein C0J52_06061 [Blattella germanica]